MLAIIQGPGPQIAFAARDAHQGQATVQARPLPAPAKPAALPGQTVKNADFSIKLPEGWTLAFPVTKRPDGTSAVFTNDRSQVTVTLNIIKKPLETRQFVDLVLPNMRQSGLNPSKPRNIGNKSMATLNGQAKGEAWFAANGKTAVATIILAPKSDIHSANVFLKAVSSPLRNLIPEAVSTGKP